MVRSRSRRRDTRCPLLGAICGMTLCLIIAACSASGVSPGTSQTATPATLAASATVAPTSSPSETSSPSPIAVASPSHAASPTPAEVPSEPPVSNLAVGSGQGRGDGRDGRYSSRVRDEWRDRVRRAGGWPLVRQGHGPLRRRPRLSHLLLEGRRDLIGAGGVAHFGGR